MSAPSRVLVNWTTERKFESGREGRPTILLDVGTLIALSMRPTFWAFAAAGFLACVVGVIRSRHRVRYAIENKLFPR